MHGDVFINPLAPCARVRCFEPVQEVMKHIASEAVANDDARLPSIVFHQVLETSQRMSMWVGGFLFGEEKSHCTSICNRVLVKKRSLDSSNLGASLQS